MSSIEKLSSNTTAVREQPLGARQNNLDDRVMIVFASAVTTLSLLAVGSFLGSIEFIYTSCVVGSIPLAIVVNTAAREPGFYGPTEANTVDAKTP